MAEESRGKITHGLNVRLVLDLVLVYSHCGFDLAHSGPDQDGQHEERSCVLRRDYLRFDRGLDSHPILQEARHDIIR